MPSKRKIMSTILDIGWEKKVPNLFPNRLQKKRSQTMMKGKLPKRNLGLIGNLLKTMLNQGQLVSLQWCSRVP